PPQSQGRTARVLLATLEVRERRRGSGDGVSSPRRARAASAVTRGRRGTAVAHIAWALRHREDDATPKRRPGGPVARRPSGPAAQWPGGPVARRPGDAPQSGSTTTGSPGRIAPSRSTLAYRRLTPRLRSWLMRPKSPSTNHPAFFEHGSAYADT